MTRFPKESEPYKKHEKIREMMCHKFARMLLELEEGEELYDPDPENQYDVGDRIMVPSWKVTGSPSKKGRGEAAKWMLERNPNWDGSTKAIRREIAQTFNHSQEKIPGSFGFGIILSVEVRNFKRHPYKPLPIGIYDIDGNIVLSE